MGQIATMIDGQRVLGVINARGGSKRVPRKNVREVKGKPLIAWTIEEAKKSKHIDRLILSSDDPGILEVAQLWGCEAPFLRPAAMAQDETNGVIPVLHALKQLPGYDVVVLLQPTSPLRTAADIDGCLQQCVAMDSNACVSVTSAEKSPAWMYFLDADARMEPILGREAHVEPGQPPPTAYVLNGAVYVARTDWLEKTRTFVTSETVAYIMPASHSLDIDTEFDFRMLDALIEDRQV